MKELLLKILEEGQAEEMFYIDDVEYISTREVRERLADHLLANGVIVLPCKVDDTIYRCGDPIKKVHEWQIEHIEIYGDEVVFVDDSDNTFTEDDIGKTIFLTREEAERALKGGEG